MLEGLSYWTRVLFCLSLTWAASSLQVVLQTTEQQQLSNGTMERSGLFLSIFSGLLLLLVLSPTFAETLELLVPVGSE
jgi:hypothetical protein